MPANPKFNLVTVSVISSAGTVTNGPATVTTGQPFTVSATVQNLSQDRDLTASVSLVGIAADGTPTTLSPSYLSPDQQATQPLPMQAGQAGSVIWTLTPDANFPPSIQVAVIDGDNPTTIAITVTSPSPEGPIPTTTTLVYTPPSGPAAGFLTATVTPTPTDGSVQFFQNGSSVFSQAISAGVATYTLTQPPAVSLTGSVLTAASQAGIPSVPVNFIQYPSTTPTPAITGPGGAYLLSVQTPPLAPGTYSFTAEYSGSSDKSYSPSDSNTRSVTVPAQPVQVSFPASCSFNGQTMALKSPASIYVPQPSAATQLPITYYELRVSQVSGVVQQQTATGTLLPLSGVQVNLVDPSNQAIVNGTTTDAQGNFCLSPSGPISPQGATFVVQFPASVSMSGNTLVLSTATQMSVLLTPDAPTTLMWPFIYTPQLSTIIGQVTDGENGLFGIPIELSVKQPSTPMSTTTDQSGFYTFSGLAPGPAQLLFPATATDSNGAEWELQPGQAGTQNVSILAGKVVQAATVAYQPEQHTIEQLVLMDGSPAEDVLVDVRPKGNHFAAQAQRTGNDGKVTFVLPNSGLYEVRVYPDPSASGGPQVNVIEVNSNAVGPTVNLPRAGGGAGSRGGSAQNGDRSSSDLQAYPVLTQDFSPGALPSATSPAQVGAIGGTSALGMAADKAIREVLSWRTKSDDPKGFVGALNQAFDLKEVEGHTEWTWTPRSYTVQTDLGAVTGAQASIYTRAKVALDQSMPLLDGLYALIPYVEQEDLVTVQAVVRSQFTALVNEFGEVGGPRVPRVDELFELLLGPGTPSNPEDIKKSGSLGLVRQRFGLERRYVTTVDDEQNLTNYLILVDYVIGLKKSWDYDKTFFIRTFMGDTERRPFFGTQLVLMSRALEVVTQGVQDAYYTMDSVFMGDPERQTAQLDFANLQVSIPDRKGGNSYLYTFPPDTSGLFVAELLDWVYRAASDELPRLLQDAGKDGLESFTASTDRLRKFVHAAIVPPQNARGLPPGYYTPRVKRALQLLADGLDEAYRLAFQIRPPEFPAELTPEELRRIRQSLAQTGSGTSNTATKAASPGPGAGPRPGAKGGTPGGPTISSTPGMGFPAKVNGWDADWESR